MDAEKLKVSTTTSGQPPEPGREHADAPGPIDARTGMHTSYWVLTPEERAKGFVRPVRMSYRHVGLPAPKHPLRDLTDEEKNRYVSPEHNYGYVKYEAYPPSDNPIAGRYWTQASLDKVDRGCGQVTTMGRAIAETYARDPHYYGSTFCATCGVHLLVGEMGEFVWTGSTERVGT
jgi:hypothetical protein